MSRRAVLLFAALGVTWGIPYLLIKIAVLELDPAAVVLGRSAIGALVLLPIVLARRQVLPVLRRWRPLLLYTVVEIVVPWFLLTSAEQRLPSSLPAPLFSTVPLVGVAVAFLTGRPERMTGANWAGIACGMLGVIALVGLDVGTTDVVALAQMAAVVVGYALGPVILTRAMADLPGTGVVALSLAITALVYAVAVPLTGAWPDRPPSVHAIVAVVTLAVVCSAAAFIMLFALIAEVGPVRSTMITYLNPAVAVAAGALVLHEPVTLVTLLGFVLVLGGAVLVNRRRPAPPPGPEAVPAVVSDTGRAP